MAANRSAPPRGDATTDMTVAPAFMLLFSIRLAKVFAGFDAQFPGIAPLPAEQEKAYLAQFSDFEGRLLGETFLQARRIKRWPLGRIALAGDLENAPPYADVYLLAHKSGIALMGSVVSCIRSAVRRDAVDHVARSGGRRRVGRAALARPRADQSGNCR